MPAFNFDEGASAQGSKYVTLGFQPGTPLRVSLPKGFAEMEFVFLPAHAPKGADGYDATQFLPYRDADDRFTYWLGDVGLYSYYGPDKNYTIASPKSLDAHALDPMAELFQTARNTPDLCDLAGLGRDGKKDQNNPQAYKTAILKPMTSMGMVNAVPLTGKDEGKNILLCLNASAFGSAKEPKWGLIGQLHRKNRNVPANTPQEDYGTRFYWPDITNPDDARPVRVFKEPSPSNPKGPQMFNCTPVEDANGNPAAGIVITDEQLIGRSYLPDVLVPQEKTELIDLMFAMFADYPQLLQRAFMNKVPGTENRLKAHGVVSDSVVRQVGGRRDVAAVSAAVTHTATAEDDAPDADAGDDIDVSPRQPAAPATAKFAPRVAATVAPTSAAPARSVARTPAPVIAKPAAFAPTAGANSNGNGAAPTARRSAAAPVAAVTLDGTAGDAAAADILAKLDEEDAKQQALANG